MISTYTLFLHLLAIFLIVRFVLRANLSSPSFIFTASYTICGLATLVQSVEWEIEKINVETYNMIIYSLVTFLVVELIIRMFASRRNEYFFHRINNGHYVLQKNKIKVPRNIINISIKIGIIGIIWSFYFIMQYALSGNFIAIMADYKDTLNMDAGSLGLGKTLLNQLNKVSTGLNYTLLFAYCYNNAIDELTKEERKLYKKSFYIYMIFRFFLAGGRQTLLFFLVAWLTCYLITKTFGVDRKSKKKVERKYVMIMSVVVAIVLPLFYYMGRLAGRKEGLVMDAATTYLATGFYGLQQIVDRGYTSSYWGEYSFPGLVTFLKFFGVIPDTAYGKAFLDFFYHGNTVSLVGRWAWDFGASGVYIMTAITSLFFSIIYYFGIYSSVDRNKRNFNIIIYCYSVFVLYFAGYDDFAMNVVSITYVLIIIITYLCYKYIIVKNNN